MRRSLIVICLLTAGSAWADITDSGNMVIGGQGIVQGTMTVQGSALSVGTAPATTVRLSSGAVFVPELAAPATPASGQGVLYEKSDGKLYFKNDDGTENDLTSGGKLVQIAFASSTALVTTTTPLPADDTIPQNTEGAQVLEATITPESASNRLVIRAVVQVANAATGYKAASALFQDATAGALAAAVVNEGDAERIQDVVLTHVMNAGTTSATTFKLRAGAQNSSTTTINGEGGSRLYGGALASTLTILEVRP